MNYLQTFDLLMDLMIQDLWEMLLGKVCLKVTLKKMLWNLEAIKVHLLGTTNVSTKSTSSLQQMLRYFSLHQSGGAAKCLTLPSL